MPSDEFEVIGDTTTKIGDVFEVPLEAKTKRYFQYVANDQSQLGADVIRVFTKAYN